MYGETVETRRGIFPGNFFTPLKHISINDEHAAYSPTNDSSLCAGSAASRRQGEVE